jgi:hypothetical protein
MPSCWRRGGIPPCQGKPRRSDQCAFAVIRAPIYGVATASVTTPGSG